jgi:8-oxo-dGTP diphosphatase
MPEQRAIKYRPQVGVGLIVQRTYKGRLQILLHRRKKVATGSGYWGSGGGYLNYGEPLQAGALREFHEESSNGVKIKNVRFLGICNFLDFKPYHSVDVSFLADWVSGEPRSADNEEAVEWRWFDADNLPSPLFPVVGYHLAAYAKDTILTDSEQR